MGLRLREGVSLARLAALGMDDIAGNIAALGEIGMVGVDAERLRVTAAGRPVLNAVLRQLLGA
jgi:oxygen-independent coproporphyrinogen-3 oxidase